MRALFGRCFLVPGEAPRTLMVGSSDVGEGKTFLTLALAAFAATTGRRVLVIEADLRRPSICNVLDLPRGEGLSEFLRDTKPFRGADALASIVTRHQGLHVIAAGAPVVSSTELLSSGRFDALMSVARANYDLVVVDSPPSLLLMDAQVLARRVDAIIYCASYGRSQLDRVMAGIRAVSGAGGRVLGMVVGGVRSGEMLDYGVVSLPPPYIAAIGR